MSSISTQSLWPIRNRLCAPGTGDSFAKHIACSQAHCTNKVSATFEGIDCGPLQGIQRDRKDVQRLTVLCATPRARASLNNLKMFSTSPPEQRELRLLLWRRVVSPSVQHPPPHLHLLRLRPHRQGHPREYTDNAMQYSCTPWIHAIKIWNYIQGRRSYRTCIHQYPSTEFSRPPGKPSYNTSTIRIHDNEDCS